MSHLRVIQGIYIYCIYIFLVLCEQKNLVCLGVQSFKPFLGKLQVYLLIRLACNRRRNLPEIGPAKSPIFEHLRRREVWAEMRRIPEAQVTGCVWRRQRLTRRAVCVGIMCLCVYQYTYIWQRLTRRDVCVGIMLFIYLCVCDNIHKHIYMTICIHTTGASRFEREGGREGVARGAKVHVQFTFVSQ